MSDAELSARLVEAMSAAASQEAPATLVSVTIEVLGQGAAERVEARLVRKTRTLIFMSAEAFAAEGDRLASASAIYKV